MAEKTAQKNTPKLIKASARALKISPRKMRLLTNMVKGMRAEEAVVQLQFTNKKAAKMLEKLIRSASANAENNFSMNSHDLFVKSVTCDMGQTVKRYFPRARGSAFVIRRKMAHVNLILEERAGSAAKKSRFNILKKEKKDKPNITQEGSVGTPEVAESAVTEKPANVKESHYENTNETVKQKAGEEKTLK
jgi:large subunit ribosomal protein L22